MFFVPRAENVKNRENTAYLTLFGGLQEPPIWRFSGVCKKYPTTKITTTATTGPSSNSNNNNNNNDDDDADDEDDDNNDNDDNDDNDGNDDNKDNDNDNTNKNNNKNDNDNTNKFRWNPPLSFPPPTPPGIAGVRSSTIIMQYTFLWLFRYDMLWLCIVYVWVGSRCKPLMPFVFAPVSPGCWRTAGRAQAPQAHVQMPQRTWRNRKLFSFAETSWLMKFRAFLFRSLYWNPKFLFLLQEFHSMSICVTIW